MPQEPKRRHSVARKGKRRSSISLKLVLNTHKLSKAKKRKLV
jgi:ribosomal protein L32